MLVPVSWLAEHVSLPAGVTTEQLDAAFVRMAYEVEGVDDLHARVRGPLVVGRISEIEELTGFKKPIRHCQVDVGADAPASIVCGATNFAVGDLVAVALPGAVLPGEFTISARKSYGRLSDGMICSERELGLGDDHSGIMVLSPDVDVAPGSDARSVVGLDEVVFDLNINPDRGYAFSIRGLARDLALALDVPFHDPADLGIPPDSAGSADRADAPGRDASGEATPVTRVLDTVGCDRFAVRAVRGVNPATASPQWMRRRLTHAGMRPISLPVDITNYLMLELGQPMHAFDLAKLSGELTVRRARHGERLTTLDGVGRTLHADDMVICDDTGPISLAAVMGGVSTEVNVGTVDVLFEAAHWDPTMVARTSRRHKLASEAGKRWERGVDPQLPLLALERAVRLLATHAGGTVDDHVIDIDHVRPPESIRIAAGLAVRVSGLERRELGSADEAGAYRAVGCAVAIDHSDSVDRPDRGLGGGVSDGRDDGRDDGFVVTPPTWRPDLSDPYDLIEEFARLSGYHHVPSVLPTAPPGRGLTAGQRRRRSVGRALAEAGYVEVLSYPFVSPSLHDAWGLPADDPRRITCRLANPLSDEEPQLRTALLGPLLATLRRNLARGRRDLALFESGLVFLPEEVDRGGPPTLPVERPPRDAELRAAQQFVPRQPWRVAAVLVGDVEPPGWWGEGRVASWSDAVQAAHLVAETAGVSLVARATAFRPWHPGRCAELRLPPDLGSAVVGHAGQLHPAVCDAMDLPRGVCAMELELDQMPLPSVATAPDVSTFPPALLDVALLIDQQVPAAAVQRALAAGAGELLESIRLFDVFSGEQLGQGRKSLAYKLVFRATDRTLTVEEAVAARDAAVAEASRAAGAVLRGG